MRMGNLSKMAKNEEEKIVENFEIEEIKLISEQDCTTAVTKGLHCNG